MTTIPMSSNRPPFLSPTSRVLKGFKEELLDDLGVSIVPSYIGPVTLTALDRVVAQAMSGIKELLDNYPELNPAGDLMLDVPLPRSLEFMRILRTGGHFELEFFPLTNLAMRQTYVGEVQFGPRAYLKDTSDTWRDLFPPAGDPGFQFVNLDQVSPERYKAFILAAAEIGDHARLQERRIEANDVRLDTLSHASKTHIYIEYDPLTRPRDIQKGFHTDGSGSVFMSLQISSEPSVWFRGTGAHALSTVRQGEGDLVVVNNHLSSPHPTNPRAQERGPIHDVVAPESGRRTVLYYMGMENIREVLLESLCFDIDQCPSHDDWPSLDFVFASTPRDPFIDGWG